MQFVLPTAKYICRDAKGFGSVLTVISLRDQGLDGIFISYNIMCVSCLLTIYTVLSDEHLRIVL